MALDAKFLAKAKLRLRSLERAVAGLRQAETFADFQDEWYFFLVSFKTVYTALEQASKATGPDQVWFGLKKSERKNDPLLRYLYQARDDAEHGLSEGLDLEPGSLAIGVNREGASTHIHIEELRLEDGVAHVKGFKGLDDKPVLIEHSAPKAVLRTVICRGPVSYHPPSEHLGKSLANPSPLNVAELGFSHLTELVREAANRT